MCGMTVGWFAQTCLQAMEAGKLSTQRLKRPAREFSAVVPLLSQLSAMVRSTLNMTPRLCLPRFVKHRTKIYRALKQVCLSCVCNCNEYLTHSCTDHVTNWRKCGCDSTFSTCFHFIISGCHCKSNLLKGHTLR